MGALDECQYIYQHFEIICELWKGVSKCLWCFQEEPFVTAPKFEETAVELPFRLIKSFVNLFL